MVGCGNSSMLLPKFLIPCLTIELSEQMYDDGFSNIINIDISDKVIQLMREKALKANKNMICK